jgi:AraC-like DNA-binding protein
MGGFCDDPKRNFVQSDSPEFVVTSGGHGWDDAFYAEVRRRTPIHGVRTEHRHEHLCIQSYGAPARQRRIGANDDAWSMRDKGIRVWLPGDEQFCETTAERAHNRFLFVSREAVARILGERFDPRRFAAFHGRVGDAPAVRASLAAIGLDLSAGAPAGRVFAECQIAAVVGWLARAPAATQRRPRLMPRQIERLRDLVDARLAEDLSLAELAAALDLPMRHLRVAMAATFGTSPTRFIQERRLRRAQQMMAASTATLTSIAADCGFADQAHMCRLFRRDVGTSPSAWRRGAAAPGAADAGGAAHSRL